jgi:hypothetical protein
MAGIRAIRALLWGGAALAVMDAGGPALADEIYPEQMEQFHDLTMSVLAPDLLGGVVAQPVETAWQQIPTSTDQLTPQQQSELKQLKTGTIEYVVEIPPEQRTPGGPTHKIVTAPAPFGGLDDMVEVLTGSEGPLSGSQFQSTDVGSMSPASFLQSDLGNALSGNGSALADALTGGFGQ